ncbi:MAG: hypothetical protein ACMXX7_00180 [Candidatus Woesearchaeota archaeon]
MVDVSINYETLFDLLRREKSRGELQELDSDFYVQVNSYFNEKKSMLNSSQKLQSTAEKEKIKIQLKNAQKIIKELFDVRQKKIINHAVNKVKTGSALLASSNLLELEKSLFEEICSMLRSYQLKFDGLVFDEKPVDVSVEKKVFEDDEKQEVSEKKSEYKVKFLSDIPKFVGLDKNVYGPFSKGDEVSLPEKITNLLLNKGRVELL